MRIRAAPLFAFALVVVLASGACFDAQVPADADVLCASAADCADDQVCDVAHHVCVARGSAIDTTPPDVTDVRFTPSATNGARADLVIVASEELAVAPGVVFLSPLAPALGAAASDGNTHTFALDLATTPDGVYALASITLVDAAGNSFVRPSSDVVLVVDRRAPQLFDLALEDGTPGDGTLTFADVAPHDQVRVRFATEPLAELPSVTVGLVAAPCALGDDGAHTCDVVVAPGNMQDGANPIVIDVVDVAGNANRRTLTETFDADNPALLAAEIALADPQGTPTGTAYEGGTLAVTLHFGEAVAPPVVALQPGNVALADVSGGGATWVAALELPALADGTTYTVRASFADEVGHAVTNELVALPAPFAAGVPFSSAFAGACAIPGTLCADLDGDGVEGTTEACPSGRDCDDNDASRFDTSPVRPGDTRGPGCEAGPAVDLVDAEGVFVDPATGSDTNDGTANNPFATLTPAVTAATNAGLAYIFIAGSEVPVALATPQDFQIEQSIIGGLKHDGAGWSRDTPIRSVITAGAPTILVGPLLERVEWSGGLVNLRTSVTVDCTFLVPVIAAAQFADAVIARSSFSGNLTVVGGRAIRIAENVTIVAGLFVDGTAFTHRVTVGASSVAGTLIATSSVFGTNALATGPSLHCLGCSGLGLYHSTVLGRMTATPSGGVVIEDSGGVVIVGSVIANANPGPALTLLGSNTVSVFDTDLFPSQGAVLSTNNEEDYLVDVNDCSFVGCGDAARNYEENPDFADFHLTPGSGVQNLGAEVLSHAAPSSVAADYDGDCRYVDVAADLGADEIVSQ